MTDLKDGADDTLDVNIYALLKVTSVSGFLFARAARPLADGHFCRRRLAGGNVAKLPVICRYARRERSFAPRSVPAAEIDGAGDLALVVHARLCAVYKCPIRISARRSRCPN